MQRRNNPSLTYQGPGKGTNHRPNARLFVEKHNGVTLSVPCSSRVRTLFVPHQGACIVSLCDERRAAQRVLATVQRTSPCIAILGPTETLPESLRAHFLPCLITTRLLIMVPIGVSAYCMVRA